MIRILVLAPTPAARAGWRALLTEDATGDLTVVGGVATSSELPDQVAALQPDILLLDPLPSDDALIDTLAQLTSQHPGLNAILLGPALPASRYPEAVNEALRAGVRAYLPVDAAGPELIATVRAVTQGLIVLDPAIAGPLLDHLTDEPALPLSPPVATPLTTREIQVLQLLAQGFTNRGIAVQLNISEHTVKFHVSALLAKLGAASRAEAVALAARQGLILV